jgi:vesicle coat complex subunit
MIWSWRSYEYSQGRLLVTSSFANLQCYLSSLTHLPICSLLHLHFSPDLDVRRKALRIALEMTSTRNVQDVVLFLKKELAKTHDQEYEKVKESTLYQPTSFSMLTRHHILEQRISAIAHSIHSLLRYQILRSGSKCCPCPHGVLE